MPLYCGIDLHSNNSLISVIDDADQIQFEKRLPNELSTIVRALVPFQSDLVGVVVESTCNWYWLVDGLIDAGFDVRLANTVAIKQYSGLKHTDDKTDARFLAHLFRLDLLPQGYIYPRETRCVRDLFRRRLLWVRQRVMQRLSLQSLIARHTGIRMSSAKLEKLRWSDIIQVLDHPSAQLVARLNLTQIESLSTSID